MTILEITLWGDPVAKGRPRVGPNGHAYTPERTRAAERAAVAQFQAAMEGREPYGGPVGLAVEFFCATRRKSDGDNLLKLLTDSMNQVVIIDDAQIEEWYCRLHRGVGKKDARTTLLVHELNPIELSVPPVPSVEPGGPQ
jgi:Holliday junction resolvase RusA-like endonuclease